MFDIRDLSNTAIVLIVIIAASSIYAARAITMPVATHLAVESPATVDETLKVDSNLAFNLEPQAVQVNVDDTFVLTVTVENASDMFGWQVYMVFNRTVLQCTGMSLPSSNVFSDKTSVSNALAQYSPEAFPTGPLRHIENDGGWVLAGDCLLGASQQTFYGSGVLCQIEFKAVSAGFTTIALLHDSAHMFQTYNLNFDIEALTSSAPSYANIYVSSR